MTQRTVEALQAVLKPLHLSSVRVSLVREAAVGTNLVDIQRQLDERDKNPTWCAKHGPVEIEVSRDEMNALIDAGATKEYEAQRITLPSEARAAVPCAGCDRWLACGDSYPREGECHCGQKFVVTVNGPANDRIPHVMMCCCCGAELTAEPAPSTRSPWGLLNSNRHLPRCRQCDHTYEVVCWRDQPETAHLRD